MSNKQLTLAEHCAAERETHRDGDLSQDVLGDAHALLDHLLVELVEGGVHQLHADPHVALATRRNVQEEIRERMSANKSTWTHSRPGSDSLLQEANSIRKSLSVVETHRSESKTRLSDLTETYQLISRCDEEFTIQ